MRQIPVARVMDLKTADSLVGLAPVGMGIGAGTLQL